MLGGRQIPWLTHTWIHVEMDIMVVCVPDIPLMHPHEVNDQTLVKDVVGTCTLWNWRYVKVVNWHTLVTTNLYEFFDEWVFVIINTLFHQHTMNFVLFLVDLVMKHWNFHIIHSSCILENCFSYCTIELLTCVFC